VHFQEGQLVHAGDPLFTIDPRTLQANLAQSTAIIQKDTAVYESDKASVDRDAAQVKLAKATLAKDIAQRNFAQAEEKRYKSLLQQDYISHEQYEQTLTNYYAAEETVKADKAAVENAIALMHSDEKMAVSVLSAIQADKATAQSNALQVGFAYIRAPLTGMTGSFLLHQGDVVRPDDATLVTIQQIDPIKVSFTIPQQYLAEIRQAQANGTLQVKAAVSEASHVMQTIPDQQKLVTGQLSFIDNAIDPGTGTIRLKGLFKNTSKELWPAQYVDVYLVLGTQEHAITIPNQAVQTGQHGAYVFVDRHGKAVVQLVTVARTIEDTAIIEKGLMAGEKVIVDGQLQLAPGSRLKVKRPSAP
jgi:multidrug efflux system membrane fusion protein